jgi:hypothetical protein
MGKISHFCYLRVTYYSTVMSNPFTIYDTQQAEGDDDLFFRPN